MFSINDFPKNDEIISTSGIPATEKGEQTETSFNLIDQQTGSFPRDSGHPGPSLGGITHIQADLRTPYNPQAVTTMSSHQLINQYQLPAYQSTNGEMPSSQVNTQNRFSVIRSSHQVAANDHLNACAISTVPLNYMPSIQDETDQPEFPSYNVDYCSPESRQGMQFVDANVKGSGCQCCSHESSLMHPSHVPVFEVENYRYSVIMVPIKWNNTACQVCVTIIKFLKKVLKTDVDYRTLLHPQVLSAT